MKADLSPQELMKAMGSKSGFFDPIPPDQHAWPMKVAAIQPGKITPLLRLWSWMCAHTIRKGRRKGYVCDDRGKLLTVENAAEDLGIDPGVCRRAWREGAALGLWRKGTHAPDKRHLFLNAKVVPVPAEPEEDEEQEADSNSEISDTKKGEEEAKEVCTDLFPPYISKQIKQLPKVKRQDFEAEYRRNERLKLAVHADVTMAVRLIFDQRENSIFSKFGIKKIREEHTAKNGNARPPVRAQLIQEFLPGFEKFVQTFEERSVQAQPEFVQTTETVAVQTAAKDPETGATPRHAKSSDDGSKRAVLESQRTSLRSPSSSAVPLARSESKAEDEEDPLYPKFKAQYPAAHFDEAKAKPSFEKKTKTEQARILERLQIYLTCERWQDEGGRWIPLANTWLQSYDADPPPVLKKKSTTSDKPSWNELDDMIEQAKASERVQKAGD